MILRRIGCDCSFLTMLRLLVVLRRFTYKLSFYSDMAYLAALRATARPSRIISTSAIKLVAALNAMSIAAAP